MSVVKISHPTKAIHTSIRIPGSKSESNRALILNALSGNQLTIHNLSTARDTQRLIALLASNDRTIDVLDAGTSMRFLTAYYAATNQSKIITGTERMKQRPIAPLVNTLNGMGFNIRYLEKERFAPIEIVPVDLDKISNEAAIEGNISSQFITALLLIAPFLPKGLNLTFTTELTSLPYIEMTLLMLRQLGINYKYDGHSISIPNSKLRAQSYEVSGDWSSASYWYTMAFIADEAEIFIEGLKNDWTQGDQVVADWTKRFGVITEYSDEGAFIRKVKAEYPLMMKLNFSDNPDLAQTFAAFFSAAGITANFTGLDSLKLKETDRVAALKTELAKINMHFDFSEMYEFYQLKGKLQLPNSPIKTYNDHRMALSFAPLGLIGPIEIEDPEVVNKSYPEFWEDLKKAGFEIN
jgi:3-phosphoshikimate 1-carboxyvinyltransferase